MWFLIIIGIVIVIAFLVRSNTSTSSPINDRQNKEPVDYSKLTALLAAGKWEEADNETARVMCKAVGRASNSILGKANITRFPCQELHIIDELWLEHSDGHFGFSIQLEVWQRVKETNQSHRNKLYMLADIIGWIRVSNDLATWLKWSELTYNVHTAPPGHLPSGKFRVEQGAGAWTGWEEFLDRILICKM